VILEIVYIICCDKIHYERQVVILGDSCSNQSSCIPNSYSSDNLKPIYDFRNSRNSYGYLKTRINSNNRLCLRCCFSMSTHRHINNLNRANRRRGEYSALRRLAKILERNATPPIVAAPTPHYSMKQFTSCNPPKYSGEEGATALLQWFEAMETTFLVSECPEHLKVLYATTALTKRALTFWNGQKIILGLEEITDLSWMECESMLLDEFCPDNELAKLEEEFNGLKQIGGDNNTYTTRFHELSLLIPHQVTPEFRTIKKYIRGLPIEVRNHVTTTQPSTLSSAIRMAATITDNYVSEGMLTILKKSKRETTTDPKPEEPKEKKAKFTRNYAVTTSTPQDNPTYSYIPQPIPIQSQPQIATSTLLKRAYTGTLPFCANCTFHHLTTTSCRLCSTCNRLGHFATNCRINPHLNLTPTPPARGCYNCGDPSHFKKSCPKLQTTLAPQPDRGSAFALTVAQAHDDQDQPFVQTSGEGPRRSLGPLPKSSSRLL
jgi:hypothetical protein